MNENEIKMLGKRGPPYSALIYSVDASGLNKQMLIIPKL